MNKKILFVGGTWDDEGGKRSSLVAQMYWEMDAFFEENAFFNGGTFEQLFQIARDEVVGADAIIWMPNVPNDKPKLIRQIKTINPTALLVVSKRNDGDKYAFGELVSRALRTKANMFIEICKGSDGRFVGTLFDSLSNMWDETDDFTHLARTLGMRIQQLLGYTRVRSYSVGPAKEIPEELEFFGACRHFGEKFHELVHGANTDRFLGNISFRCERGFPAFVKDGLIYVSRRNIDKRSIDRSGFVAVDVAQSAEKNGVFYYGDVKPSVDAPTQVRLFRWYKNVRYMMHSHVYLESAPGVLAPMTGEAVPCGALEEYDEIVRMFPDREAEVVRVNLLGHGCIVMAKHVLDICKTAYSARPRPELQDVKQRKDVQECQTYSSFQTPTSTTGGS